MGYNPRSVIKDLSDMNPRIFDELRYDSIINLIDWARPNNPNILQATLGSYPL